MREKAREGEVVHYLHEQGFEGPAGEAEARPVVQLRVNQALLALRDYERFEKRLPNAGGLRQQPAWWRRAMDCVLAAREKVEAEARAEQEEEREAERSRREQEGASPG